MGGTHSVLAVGLVLPNALPLLDLILVVVGVDGHQLAIQFEKDGVVTPRVLALDAKCAATDHLVRGVIYSGAELGAMDCDVLVAINILRDPGSASELVESKEVG